MFCVHFFTRAVVYVSIRIFVEYFLLVVWVWLLLVPVQFIVSEMTRYVLSGHYTLSITAAVDGIVFTEELAGALSASVFISHCFDECGQRKVFLICYAIEYWAILFRGSGCFFFRTNNEAAVCWLKLIVVCCCFLLPVAKPTGLRMTILLMLSLLWSEAV